MDVFFHPLFLVKPSLVIYVFLDFIPFSIV